MPTASPGLVAAHLREEAFVSVPDGPGWVDRSHHPKGGCRAPCGTWAWHATAPQPTIAPLYMAVIDLIGDALKHLIQDVDAFLDLCRRDHQRRIEAHTGKVAHHQQPAF